MKNSSVMQADTLPPPEDLPGEVAKLAKKVDGLDRKLDQVIELLRQLSLQSEQKKRIPWE